MVAQDLTKMQIETSVSEADIGKVQVGQDVNYTLDGYQDSVFHGKVTQVRISPTTVQNVVTYTVIVDVSIIMSKKENIMTVPNVALKFTPNTDGNGPKYKEQGIWIMEQDDIILIPITTAQKKVFGTDFPGMVKRINVQAVNSDSLDLAVEQIQELLRVRHNIGKNQDDDFTVRNLTQMMESAKEATKTMGLLLGAIASVSLLVGGIGIMNIMLVSVTERTKEIGIRMAIGAKATDIRIQFLIESLLLSVIGGLVGVIIGVTGAYAIKFFTEMNIAISSFSIFLSMGFSCLIGVVFGYYPAHKASLLNPIDALRYE